MAHSRFREQAPVIDNDIDITLEAALRIVMRNIHYYTDAELDLLICYSETEHLLRRTPEDEAITYEEHKEKESKEDY